MVGKLRDFGLIFFIEIVYESVNLMLGLNHLNWTSIAQVMVLFPGLPQLRLFNSLCQILGLVFGWETEGFWTHVLYRSCICIFELDNRLLNHLNWTSTTQVMVLFPGQP